MAHPAVEQGADRLGHCRRLLSARLTIIVFQISQRLLGVGDGLQRIGQQRDIRLLDGLSTVARILRRDAVGHRQDRQGILPLLPGASCRPPEKSCRLAGDAQVLHGDGVGERVIVDVRRILVGADHVTDVPLPRAVLLHAAHPEVGRLAQQWPRLVAQPQRITRDAEVLPGRQRHAPRDVVLVGACRRPRWRVLHATVGTLPRDHRALVAMCEGVAASSGEAVDAIVNHLTRQLGMEDEQGRVHPDLRVPEDVAVVGQRRETGGRYGQA